MDVRENMERWKGAFELIEVGLKIGLSVMAVLFFGMQRESLELEKQQLANAQAAQTSSLVVAERVIALLFEEKNKCITEDQAFLIDFLIDVHNAYNQKVLIPKEAFIRATSGRRGCATRVDGAEVQSLTVENAGKAALRAGVTIPPAPNGTPSGYVAVGVYARDTKTFRNFEVPASAIDAEGGVAATTVIKARWAVYLRANTKVTTESQNQVLGIVEEGSCIKVLESFPSVRGQTWAKIEPVSCP